MRIFIADVRELLSGGADESELAGALLSYAVAEVWGCDMPVISRDERGKPYFVGVENMHFSLSHTKTHVMAAVDEHPLGADIESMRGVKAGMERLFSPEMLADFGYFGGWTLREAVFKLRGEGSLRHMDIRLQDGEIVTPFEGVRCRRYDTEDCAVAVASCTGGFPAAPEMVNSSIFYARKA